MEIDLNNIGYGNVSKKHLKKSKRARPLIPSVDVSKVLPPTNSSPHATGELLYLLELQKRYSEGTTFMDFVEEADDDMDDLYEDFLGDIDFAYYKQLLKDLASVTILLKMEFNRMRPYQLAGILGIPLHPRKSKTAHSPSYPSGHALQSWVISEIIAEQHPELAEDARKLAADISFSREVAGYHFPSDTKYGRQLGEELLPHIVRP